MSRELRVQREHWPLARPFRISRGVKTAAETIVVEIIENGVRGRGESVPYARYGESPESVVRQIEALRDRLCGGLSRTELLTCLAAGAARNAVDCALWDLEARVSGIDVSRSLGESRIEPITTALTVSLDSPEVMARSARELADVPLVKVKVDASRPAEQIRAVREACPLSELIVDPNESWNAALLRTMTPVLAENRVALLEQPLPAGSESDLEGLECGVPICADESCHTAEDLGNLTGRFQFVNIKLDKTGGLTAALDLLYRAREAGFGIMVGCMICTSLSIAPAWQIARKARFADLDGPLWLAQDRPGGVSLNRGRLQPPAPGFWGSATG